MGIVMLRLWCFECGFVVVFVCYMLGTSLKVRSEISVWSMLGCYDRVWHRPGESVASTLYLNSLDTCFRRLDHRQRNTPQRTCASIRTPLTQDQAPHPNRSLHPKTPPFSLLHLYPTSPTTSSGHLAKTIAFPGTIPGCGLKIRHLLFPSSTSET